jgi:hypothetical protein
MKFNYTKDAFKLKNKDVDLYNDLIFFFVHGYEIKQA